MSNSSASDVELEEYLQLHSLPSSFPNIQVTPEYDPKVVAQQIRLRRINQLLSEVMELTGMVLCVLQTSTPDQQKLRTTIAFYENVLKYMQHK